LHPGGQALFYLLVGQTERIRQTESLFSLLGEFVFLHALTRKVEKDHFVASKKKKKATMADAGAGGGVPLEMECGWKGSLRRS
jgi:hypothetical protein